MAQVGAESSIRLLLDAAKQVAAEQDMRAIAAQAAINYVDREETVPVLAAELKGPRLDRSGALAATALNQMGTEAAGTALVGFLRRADATAAPFARQFAARTRTPAMLEIWTSAAAAETTFATQAVKAAIVQGLADYRGASRQEP